MSNGNALVLPEASGIDAWYGNEVSMIPISRVPASRPRPPILVPCLVAAAALASIAISPSALVSIVSNRPDAPALASADPSRLRRVAIPEKHSIDRAQIGSADVILTGGARRVTVAQGAPLTIYGWAVDAGARRPSAAVYATLAGAVVLARGNIDRGDVAVGLGNPAYLGSGFALDIATADLPIGTTTIAFHAVDASGKGRYDIGPPVLLDVTAPSVAR